MAVTGREPNLAYVVPVADHTGRHARQAQRCVPLTVDAAERTRQIAIRHNRACPGVGLQPQRNSARQPDSAVQPEATVLHPTPNADQHVRHQPWRQRSKI